MAAEYQSIRKEIAGVPVEKLATEFGGTPLFVYDADVIKARCASLREFGTVRFAQKSCPNLAILKLIKEQGVKVDAVSAGEILRALAVGYKPEEIAYTADIFDDDALELVTGKAFGCVVNVGSPDMIYQLGLALGDRADGFELTMRVNPGFGHGHSKKTNTGGPLSKHGVWFSQIHQCVQTAEHFGMDITGLHMHIGSGSDFEHLAQVCEMMECVATAIGSRIKSISCGGGLPTPYHTGEEYFDVARYTKLWHKSIASLEASFGHKIELETEPGRYLVADSCSLVTKIQAIKKQEENVFYLVDAGFTHLPRPMLYGSYHPISIAYNPVNGGPTKQGTQEVIVGGPLCESGDVFTQEEGGVVVRRELPFANVGDYLILEVAGAYCSAMASNYNSKFLAPEVLIEGGVPRLVRKKQSFEHLIANEIF
ncbi:MAG: diaminopimelate decarboxylase [Thermoguttaceae bacterium]|nr:diaminopimelate decarboxylase [Thermoguttaceae bacterium]